MANAKYALLPKLLTPTIDPGEVIKVNLFLTGSGKVEKNKLYFSYPSSIIDLANSGEVVTCIQTATDMRTLQSQPVSGEKYMQTAPCSEVGATLCLPEAYFYDVPNRNYPGGMLPGKMSEVTWDGLPPVLLKLRTSKSASPGDYDIAMALSYLSGDELELSKESVRVHITSWTDRHARSTVLVGIVLTLAALFVSLYHS